MISLTLPLTLTGLYGVSCTPKERPDADLATIAAWEESMRDGGRQTTADEPTVGPSSESTLPVMGGVEPDPSDEASATCGLDAGACSLVDGGLVDPACVPTGMRDCSSDLDNDCDRQPDNVVDDVCICVPGSVEVCGEHPGLDGQGQCRAGLRRCLFDAVTLRTVWSECDDAVGPGAQDSCIPGDDSDCDGTPNEGCSCVNSETQPCGSTTNTGPCQIGTSTCSNGVFGQCVGAIAPAARDSCATLGDDANCNGVRNEGCSCINGETQLCGPNTDAGICQRGTRACVNGAFGPCVGAVFPTARNCSSPQDNDCDGLVDNTIDNVCECVPGGGNGPCSDDPNNAQCSAQGRCVPCEADPDCSLVGGGRQFCSRQGQCVARFVCGETSPPAPTVFPPARLISSAAPSTGGTIVDGEYVQTDRFVGQLPFNSPFIIAQSIAFRGQFAHVRWTEFFDENDPGGPLDELVGTYTTSGNLLTIDYFNCTESGSGSFAFQYSASSSSLELISTTQRDALSGRFTLR